MMCCVSLAQLLLQRFIRADNSDQVHSVCIDDLFCTLARGQIVLDGAQHLATQQRQDAVRLLDEKNTGPKLLQADCHGQTLDP